MTSASHANSGLARALVVAALAAAAIVASMIQLQRADDGVVEETTLVGSTPATVFRPASGAVGPSVVVAHGFAGSQQLMRPFALALARNGYPAVTFDFLGHGRNPVPLGGSITQEQGATRRLVNETAQVAAFARPLGDGRLAVLGHSMASDIVIRAAQSDPTIGATVAVSMFSPVVTATSPRNLLVIVGAWEGMLTAEALRVAALVSAPAAAQPGVTYGNVAAGTARRVAVSPHVEHVGVLYSGASLAEAVSWMDAAFGTRRAGAAPAVPVVGPWVMLLLAGVVALAWPLSRLLPRVSATPAGASLRWREAWLFAVPMLATPLVLRVVPTQFLPVLVADYLAAHFAVYGLVSGLCLLMLARRRGGVSATAGTVAWGAFVVALACVVAYVLVALFWPIDAYVTSFVAHPGRLVLVAAMLLGTLSYFLADEWLTRGANAGRGVYALSKVAFLVSLAIAVALDFERLFFLLIILPVIVPFMLVFGLFSTWVYRATRFPPVAAVANALAFAWALGVTFPLLAG